MATRKSGDIRRRWELRVLVALPAVWILFAAVEGFIAIQMTLGALAARSGLPQVDRVRLIVIGVSSLLALACGTSLALAVTRPMRDLLRKIQHRLRGDAAVSLTGGNELRQLSNAFDDMLLSFDKFVSDTHIVDGMPLGVLVLDKNDTVVRANAEAGRLFAAHRPLPGKTLRDLCADGAEPLLSEALSAVRSGATPLDIDPAMLFGKPADPSAEPKYVVTLQPTTRVGEVVMDVRDLQQVATIRGEIQRVDQLAALGAHVASLAHEIGGGLMGIQMLIESLEPEGDDERRLHDKLRSEVERAGRLLAEIRMFGQATTRDRVPCRLDRLVEETLWMVEPRFAEKRLTIDKRLDHAVPPVLVDRDRITQAVLNVVTNAFEATPKHGAIAVAVERARDSVNVKVANSGSFIPPEARDKVFTLFFTTKRGGSGFGLPQARRALADHGGDITLSSSPETGTEFTLRFPEHTSMPDPGPSFLPDQSAHTIGQ